MSKCEEILTNEELDCFLKSFEIWAVCMSKCISDELSLMGDMDFVDALVRLRHIETDIRDVAQKSPEKILDWMPVINADLKKCKGHFIEKLGCIADKFEKHIADLSDHCE